MRKKNNEHLFICHNCDHEFYSKKKPRNNGFIKCPRCGEMTAYREERANNIDNRHDDSYYKHDEEYNTPQFYDNIEDYHDFDHDPC